MLEDFVEALDYRTYRLRMKSQHFDGHLAAHVAKFVRRLQSQLNGTELDEGDSISILDFLKEFGDACDSIVSTKG